MKGPITRRRERRILAVLAHLGAQSEWELYALLHATQRSLTTALLNLAAEDLITCTSHFNALTASHNRIWRLAQQEDTDK